MKPKISQYLSIPAVGNTSGLGLMGLRIYWKIKYLENQQE